MKDIAHKRHHFLIMFATCMRFKVCYFTTSLDLCLHVILIQVNRFTHKLLELLMSIKSKRNSLTTIYNICIVIYTLRCF